MVTQVSGMDSKFRFIHTQGTSQAFISAQENGGRVDTEGEGIFSVESDGPPGEEMALRALAFSVRLRDGGRTLRIQNDPRDPTRYILEDERDGEETRVRGHASLPNAVQDAASTWRKRLH
jgi:hypothetical protein